ncbi:MAG TPA: c-type cytochrome domain-containing protein [Kofleriaceae bacterium]|nr:c-type cytochrome domain-containing protein [Kofleriaceae bacterium]
MIRPGLALALATLAASAGCIDSLDPDVGLPLHPACTDVDSDPATAVSYHRDLEAGIFSEYHCTKCHTAGGDTPIGLLVGGLDLGSYQGLRQGGAQSGAQVVVPGQPCESALYRKVVAGPPFGARMPQDGPPFLEADDVQLIVDWIAEGARED